MLGADVPSKDQTYLRKELVDRPRLTLCLEEDVSGWFIADPTGNGSLERQGAAGGAKANALHTPGEPCLNAHDQG